jgi:anhydro-N-acetylmuramic acid kinase
MNKNLDKLCKIGNADSRIIVGLMSGTSLDGLDVALCKFSGHGLDTQIELLQFTTVPYNAYFKSQVKEVFAKKHASLEKVCLLNEWIGIFHGKIVVDCLQKWRVKPEEVDLIASHGQTIYHAPAWLHQDAQFPNATLQIGDGDHLSVTTGIITLSDFRQKHLAAGGEGAPLAVYGDHLIFSKAGENRIMLNIGGIANFTFLPGNRDMTAIFSTDTGPGNTLMDMYVQQYFNTPYDKDSAIARSGNLHPALLDALINHTFFQQPFPKTTGPELFNLEYLRFAQNQSGTATLKHEDILRTLNRFTAVTIAQSIRQCCDTHQQYTLYSSGGGMHNPLVMEQLQELLPEFTFYTTSDLAINPDAKEAVLFAILANETIAGDQLTYGSARSGIPSVSMGKISFPD